MQPIILCLSLWLQMFLNVFAGGCGDGEGTHISAYLFLMQSENDDNLKWLMRGIFSVELLNQEGDQNHKPGSMCYEEKTAKNYNSKVSKGVHQKDGAGLNFLNTKTLKRSRFLPILKPSKTIPSTFKIP